MVIVREVDKPFRFTWDFCIVWVFLFVASVYSFPQGRGRTAFEHYGMSVVISLVATFALYGPFLVIRQILASGSRGRFVARLLLAVILIAVTVLGGMYWFDVYTPERAQAFGFVLVAVATCFLYARRAA